MENITTNILKGLEVAWLTTAAFLPKLLIALAILIVGYFVARFLERLCDRILERVGFDRLVERGGIKRALERTRYDASDLLSKILFYTIFLFVLQLAFGVFGPNPISNLLTLVIAFLPNIFVAILIVVIAAAVGKAVKDIVGSLLAGFAYGRFVANLASIAIIMVGIFAALNQLSIAPAIVNGLFYAILAVVAGSAIIAIGGGGIAPMRAEWERALDRLHVEAPRIRSQMENAPQRLETWERQGETAESGRRPVQSHN